MQNIFIDILPPWVETGLQPAFYDLESGTVLQQTARMYAKVRELTEAFNTFTENIVNEVTTFEQNTNDEIERFENATNDEIKRFENATNDEIERFEGVVNHTVEEYIEKFNELHDYVEDYFDNLDVQKEINNKLDAMVEDGTLQEIITTYIQSNVTWTFDTLAEMKASTNLINGSFAQTLGYYEVGDGGGGVYYIDNTGTADEYSVVAVGGTLKAHLIVTDKLDVKQFGAYGDGIHDDTTPIQISIYYCQSKRKPLFINKGVYLVSHLTCSNYIQFTGNGFESILKSIDNNTAGAILTLQNNALQHSEVCNIRIVGNFENNNEIIDGIKLHVTSAGASGDKYTNIHNIAIVGCTGNGIVSKGDLTGSDIREIRITDVEVAGCKLSGLYLESCTDSFFSTITSHGNVNYGFYITGGPHKIVNCKAFWNGRGDETTIEDYDRIPASAFTETSDLTPQTGKTYFTRSGKGINNNWYIFTQFTGESFAPDTTYYELTKTYYKRYAGFKLQGGSYTVTNCEAQENWGDGFWFSGSDHIYSGIIADNNGLIDESYETAGLEQLYYGAYCSCWQTSINIIGRNFRYQSIGTSQKAALFIYNCGHITARVLYSHQTSGDIFMQNASIDTLDITNQGEDFVLTANFNDFTVVSNTLTFVENADIKSSLTQQNKVNYMDFVLSDTNGFATSTTDKSLFYMPNPFRPKTTLILRGDLSDTSFWRLDSGTCTITIYPSGLVTSRANTNGEVTNAKYLHLHFVYPKH